MTDAAWRRTRPLVARRSSAQGEPTQTRHLTKELCPTAGPSWARENETTVRPHHPAATRDAGGCIL